MSQLALAVRERGIRRISLRVSRGNPAADLYERLGYRYASEDDGELMVLNLN
jgi:ribosomal protein S18 acetylase RimI-like enzyme